MRYLDSKIEPYIDGCIIIEHDEEYYYRKWWESYREEMVYVYTADKKEVFLGNVDADILFKYDNIVFQSRLISGSYPNTSNLFPNESILKVNPNTQNIISNYYKKSAKNSINKEIEKS